MNIYRVKKTVKRIIAWIGYLLCICIALLCVMPMVVTAANSFLSSAEIHANYGMIFDGLSEDKKHFIAQVVNIKLIPDWVSFSQYIEILFQTPDYLMKYWNSIFYTVPIVVFQSGIALLAAYGFTRLHGKLSAMVFFGYVMLMMMPYQVTLVPNYLVSKWLGILDTRASIWLPGIFSPFSVYLLTKYMRRIPAELMEAAKVDGAGEWKIFWKIYVPLCRSVLTACIMLVFLDYWNMVEQPLILLEKESLYPLSILLTQIGENETGVAFALAVIYMLPGFLAFLYGEEDLMEGIAYQGSVKG